MSKSIELEEKLIIFNWFYNLGKPLISDAKYNEYFQELRELNPNSEVITKTWSEFEEPTELLKKYNLLDESNKIKSELDKLNAGREFFLPTVNMQMRKEGLKDTLRYFDSLIPKSIDTIETVSDSSNWLASILTDSGKSSIDLNFSIKADGFNVSNYYYKGYYIASYTRGRTGSPDDVTIAMSKVVPLKLNTESTFVRVKCEASMYKSTLLELREMDKTREWKSPRNSMKTLLTNNVPDEFHKKIVPLAFKVEGITFDKLSDEFIFLGTSGYPTVEQVTLPISNHEELLNAVKRFSSMDMKYANDGCVVTVNDYEIYNLFDTYGKYDYAMRAYRLFNWKSNIYCSFVMDIVSSFNSKRISLGLKILPTPLSNGSTATTLDADNLSRIQKAKINKGSLVLFHIRSDSCIDWLDFESMVLNRCVSNKQDIPEKYVQAVAELEHRTREFLDNKKYGIS